MPAKVFRSSLSLPSGQFPVWVYEQLNTSPDSGSLFDMRDDAMPAQAPSHTVLFVHGFRGDHHGLELIVKALIAAQPSVRVVIPDLPGFGVAPPLGKQHTIAAYAGWLSEVHAELTLRYGAPVPVLAHSFGTIVTAHAVAAGMMLPRLILVNPIAVPALAGPNRVLSALAKAFYDGSAALSRAAARLAGQHAGERVGRALLANPVMVRGMSEIMAKTRDHQLRSFIHDQHNRYFSLYSSTSTLAEAFEASISHNVGECAAAITCPCLIITGEKDDISPLQAQLSLAKRLPQGSIRVLPGTGHLVHYEACAEAAQLAAEFFAPVWAADAGKPRAKEEL